MVRRCVRGLVHPLIPGFFRAAFLDGAVLGHGFHEQSKQFLPAVAGHRVAPAHDRNGHYRGDAERENQQQRRPDEMAADDPDRSDVDGDERSIEQGDRHLAREYVAQVLELPKSRYLRADRTTFGERQRQVEDRLERPRAGHHIPARTEIGQCSAADPPQEILGDDDDADSDDEIGEQTVAISSRSRRHRPRE